MSPITNAGGVATLETDLKAFIEEMESLASLLTTGIDKIRAEDFEGARADFTAAKAISPSILFARLLHRPELLRGRGLRNAQTSFSVLEDEDTPVGLLPYVQALTSYNLDDTKKPLRPGSPSQRREP
jgi:hypothetical protein